MRLLFFAYYRGPIVLDWSDLLALVVVLLWAFAVGYWNYLRNFRVDKIIGYGREIERGKDQVGSISTIEFLDHGGQTHRFGSPTLKFWGRGTCSRPVRIMYDPEKPRNAGLYSHWSPWVPWLSLILAVGATYWWYCIVVTQ